MSFTAECYTVRQFSLMKHLQKLWLEHVYWTRFFIISTLDNLDDIDYVTARLLKNPVDFGNLLASIYGLKMSLKFRNLLTEHLMIGGELVKAEKNQDFESANNIRKKWYINADEIASYFSSINKFWSKAVWRDMLYNHLSITEKEIKLRFEKEYDDDIDNFDEIVNQSIEMADYMYYGITKQELCR